MTIRNLASYVSSLWDWGFLSRALPGKISVTDVDGLVEVGRQFLFIEAKAETKPVPQGQAILFDHLIEEGNKTVLILRGEPNKPVSMAIWPDEPIACTEESIVAFVSDWARKARGE